MSLSAALNRILDEYPTASSQPFAGDPIAEFIRREAPLALEDIVGENDRYKIKGSAGQGTWARVPWVAVFDKFITETAQAGLYVVYLVREDCSGIYLSLNQGVTTVKQFYGTDAKEALGARASDYLARLGGIDGSVSTNE